MKIYKSKIGLEIVAPVILVLGGIGISMAYNHIWQGIVVIVLVSTFIAHMLLTTYYTITERTLHIKCGFIIDEKINIDSIQKISETHNPMSSPAASLDRLEIIYTKYDSVMISPKEKMEFIQHITSINPKIEVKVKS